MTSAPHPVFVHPSNSQISIWRYMDFTKFVSMLENKGLFLSRADNLGDPFEGSYSRGNEQQWFLESEVSPEVIHMLRENSSWQRQWIFINCWHMNECESAAMWNLYAKTNEAIAIRSTFQKLDDVLDETCHLGIVNYIDYEKDWMPPDNLFAPYVHKRLSFKHECEIRILHYPPSVNGSIIDVNQPPSGGVWKKVDLLALIDTIYISPNSPTWFKELVEQVVASYELSKPILRSELDKDPFF